MEKPRGPILLLMTSPKARWMTITICGGALVAGVFAYVCLFARSMHTLFVGETGPVTSRADWPYPLQRLLDDPDGNEIDESRIRVHCLCNGIDKEHVWRMDATPSAGSVTNAPIPESSRRFRSSANFCARGRS